MINLKDISQEKINEIEQLNIIPWGRAENLEGEKFNHWTIIGRSPTPRKCWCICDCPNHTIKEVITSQLKNNTSKSCGCIQGHNGEKVLNKQFGKLFCYEKLNEKDKKGNWLYKCKCECGNIKITTCEKLMGGLQSCGCLVTDKNIIRYNAKDLTNKKFGKLTAIERTNQRTKKGSVIWHCHCDCGNKNVYLGADSLTSGNTQSCGCIKSKGEETIALILNENNINFIKQKTFENCRYPDSNVLIHFDFYLPKYNIIIEYDGKQHFTFINTWNTKEEFEKLQKRDVFRNNWCKENNIPLIRIPYTHYNELCLDDLLLASTKFLVTE